MYNNTGNIKQSPSLGLCLSGGGARGFAHIGVLRILEREGIPVEILSGTSMGGVIAAGYAAGLDTYELEQIALDGTQKKHFRHLFDPVIPNEGGFIQGKQVLEFFQQIFGEKTFADLPRKAAVVVVDLNSRREIILDEGNVALALRATTSVPGVFKPLELDDLLLVDGGVLNNLPVDVTYQLGADIVIAVDISLNRESSFGHWVNNRFWMPSSITSMVEVLDGTLTTLRTAVQENNTRNYPPDLLIYPEMPESINTFTGYQRASESIMAGESATEKLLPQIDALLNTY